MQQPRIYLIARPSIDYEAIQKFLSDRKVSWLPTDEASDSEHLVEVSGRICYMSFSRETDKIRYPNMEYVRNLIRKGHESVLEHATWSFIIDGVSRGFTHQLVRHRVGFSYSQLSQQYHDESDANFVSPQGLSPNERAIWQDAMEKALETYHALLRSCDIADMSFEARRRLRTAARSVLPNATETTIAVTANARAIRHFLKIRGSIVGDIEMRLVSAEILRLVASDAPSLFSDFESEILEDGWPIVVQSEPI